MGLDRVGLRIKAIIVSTLPAGQHARRKGCRPRPKACSFGAWDNGMATPRPYLRTVSDGGNRTFTGHTLRGRGRRRVLWGGGTKPPTREEGLRKVRAYLDEVLGMKLQEAAQVTGPVLTGLEGSPGHCPRRGLLEKCRSGSGPVVLAPEPRPSYSGGLMALGMGRCAAIARCCHGLYFTKSMIKQAQKAWSRPFCIFH